MSRYRFIASNDPLPEIDSSGLMKRKVKELRKLYPVPQGLVSWDELGDELELLYAVNESDLDGLQISLCTNPPYGLDDFITKQNTYWLGGDCESKWLNQLMDYLNTSIPKETKIELWSIWFGYGFQKIVHKWHRLADIQTTDLELLQNSDCCITITIE